MIGKGAIRAAGRRRLSGANYIAEAVVFDGTNDYLSKTSALTGAADGKTFTISAWVYLNGTGKYQSIYWMSTTTVGSSWRMFLRVTNFQQFECQARNAAGSSIFLMQSHSTEAISGSTWAHIVISVDLGNSKAHLYVDDVATINPSQITNDNIDWTVPYSNISAYSDGAGKLDADMAEVYFTDEYLDISVESNRRKFITADGTPTDLGSDGSTPTGTQPLVYFKGAASVWNAGTNAGSGGNFTMTGAVADSSNEPVELP